MAKLKDKIEKWWKKLVAKLKHHIDEVNAEIDAARAAAETATTDTGTEAATAEAAPAVDINTPVPVSKCRYSSNWKDNASKRMMNLVSPSFSAQKVKEYLDWQQGIGCDHVHLLLVNKADGEGAGYDAICDGKHKAVALARVKEIRARGMGVVAWIVADDSDAYRKKIFAAPDKYAKGLAEYFPYVSYIVLGLEMNEGEGGKAKWQALRDAVKAAGYTGAFATHHTSGKYTYAGLGSIIMDQLNPDCTASKIKTSVTGYLKKGYQVCGFEYSRGPDSTKAQAALDAGAFGCGNWGGGKTTTAVVAENATTTTAPAGGTDEVDFSKLNFCWGGYKPSGAPSIAATIATLRVNADKISYGWVSGGCEALGASNATDAACIAALFCRDASGAWKGGKFEWISTSRTTRDTTNIKEGYNGWRAEAFNEATAYAFCILSKDGKKRTNVLVLEV